MSSIFCRASRASWRLSRWRGEKWNGLPSRKYSSHSTQPMPLAHGSRRKVAGSGTMTRFGEPVISARPMPPPRVKELKTRAPAESSVVVATLML